MLSEGGVGGVSGMGIVGTVEHSDRYPDAGEGGRLDVFLLESKDVIPGLPATLGIFRKLVTVVFDEIHG